MQSIVGIFGPQGHGKDTLADYLVAEHGYTKLSLAFSLKEFVLEQFPGTPRVSMYGTQAEKEVPQESLYDLSGREALQIVGDRIRSEDPEAFIKATHREVVRTPGHVVVPDVRYANEAAWIQGLAGSLIRVEREGHPVTYGHKSEGLWEIVTPDQHFVAGSVPELQAAAEAWLNGVG